MEQISLGLAFVAGLLSFLSPCVLPLVPAYIGYLGGRMTTAPLASAGVKAKGLPLLGRMELIGHGLAFVAGFTTIFVLFFTVVEVVFKATGPALEAAIVRLGGVLIILFGLHSLGVIPWLFKKLRQMPTLLNTPFLTILTIAAFIALIPWAIGWTWVTGLLLATLILGLLMAGAFTQPHIFWLKALDQFDEWFYADTRADFTIAKRGSVIGSYTMGVIFAAGWTPCIGPMLGSIMALAAENSRLLESMVTMLAYSLGLGIPFLLTAALLEPMQALLRRIQRSMCVIKFVSGLLMILIGVLVARGDLTALSRGLSSQFASFSIFLEECGTGVITGEVSLGQFGDCMEGIIAPVALNQGAGATLKDTVPQMIYLVTLSEPMAVDIEVSRISDPTRLVVTVKNTANETLAKSSDLIRLDDKRYTAIANLELAAAQYQIIITRSDGNSIDKSSISKSSADVDFRMKVRAAQPLPLQPITLPDDTTEITDADSPLLDLAEAVASTMTMITPEPTIGIPPVNEGIQGPSTLNTITGGAQVSGPSTGVNVGQRAPDFTITLDSGEIVKLSDLRGQIVLLNFWGTWCPPCRREMPDFQALYEQHQDEGFVLLALAERDTPEQVAQFRAELGLTFWMALDDDERINDLYNVPGQPSSFLIDQEGIIVYQTYSVVDGETVDTKILDLLAP